jgi:predicted nucleic-acid-binding protein
VLSVDCTVLVRLIANDDPKEGKRAAALFATDEIFVATSVLLETALVLQHGYRLERAALTKSLRCVLGLPNVVTQNPIEINRALLMVEDGMEFSDAVHIASSSSAAGFRTFDADLIRQAKAAGVRGVSRP